VRTYAARLPGIEEPVRVATAAEVFEKSGDSHQFFPPGGQLFEEVQHRPAPFPAGDWPGYEAELVL